jgi:hypothetical protein
MSSQKQDVKDAILAIRMSPELLKQLNILSKQKHIGTATMARGVLVDYLRGEAPNALLNTTPNQTPPIKTGFSKPSQQDSNYDSTWD